MKYLKNIIILIKGIWIVPQMGEDNFMSCGSAFSSLLKLMFEFNESNCSIIYVVLVPFTLIHWSVVKVNNYGGTCPSIALNSNTFTEHPKESKTSISDNTLQPHILSISANNSHKKDKPAFPINFFLICTFVLAFFKLAPSYVLMLSWFF